MSIEKEKLFKQEIKIFFNNTFNLGLILAAIVTLMISSVIGFGLPIVAILWLVLLFRLSFFRQIYPRKFILSVFLVIGIGLMEIWSSLLLGLAIIIVLLFIPESWWQKIKK